MNEPIYALHGVTKDYQARRVLDVTELSVRKGEVFALVGPSGAGKSTLLRLLNFLELPTSGELRFLGADVSDTQVLSISQRRKVTMVFQRPILLNRDLRANVAYGLHLRGQHDVDSRVHSVLQQVGLARLAGHKARTLSGGEAQRVALARAIVLEPDVLLLDEPTANLDPYNVSLIEDIVRALNRERGTTIVVVTHNVFQARRLAHRVGLILEGRLVEVGEAKAFFEAPQDARTQAFIEGKMVY